MALNALGLGIIFSAKDQATRVMGRVQRKFTSLDRTSTETAKRFKANVAQGIVGIGAMAGGLVVLGGAFLQARAAGEFEQSLVAVQQITRGTAEDMSKLRDAALQAGLATKFSPQEAVGGLQVLGQAGLSAAESMGALNPVLNLATGGNIGIAQSAETAVAAMNAFGISLDDLTGASDMMFRSTQQSTLQMQDMQLAIGNVARGASLTNQSLGEMLNTMGLIKDTGVDVSTASTSVTRALSAMAQKQDDLKKLGVEVSNEDGSFRDFTDVVLDLNDSLNKRFPKAADRASQAMKIFGQRGVAAFTGTIAGLEKQVERSGGSLKNMREAVAKLRDGMADSAGTTQQFVDAMLNTFEGQKTLLRGALQTINVLIGEGFARVFKPLVGAFVRATTTIAEFINSMSESTRNTIAKIILAFGAFLTALGALITMKAGIALLILAFKAFGPVIIAALAPLLPTVGILSAAILVFLAFREAGKNAASSIGQSFKDGFKKIGLAFKAIAQLFTQGGFTGEVRKELLKAENQGVKAFAIKVFLWFNRVKNFFVGIVDGFREGVRFLMPIFEAFHGALMTLAEALGINVGKTDANRSAWAAFGAVGNVVGQILATVAGIITSVLIVAIGLLTDAITIAKDVWESFGFIWNNVVDGMKFVWNDFMGWIFGKIRALVEGIDSIAGAIGIDLGFTDALNQLEKAVTFDVIARAGPSPAVAANEAIASSNAPVAAALMSSADNMSRMSQAPVQLVSRIDLNVDNERLQSIQVRQNRSSQSRSLMPVPATEGAGG